MIADNDSFDKLLVNNPLPNTPGLHRIESFCIISIISSAQNKLSIAQFTRRDTIKSLLVFRSEYMA